MTAEPLPIALIAMNYLGDTVFAFSGALVAARHRMDILGIVLIGMVTGIGGGTPRDIILGHPVWRDTRSLDADAPMILSGEIYATAALIGAAAYAVLSRYGVDHSLAAFAVAFVTRGASMLFHIRFGVMGEPIITVGRNPEAWPPGSPGPPAA